MSKVWLEMIINDIIKEEDNENVLVNDILPGEGTFASEAEQLADKYLQELHEGTHDLEGTLPLTDELVMEIKQSLIAEMDLNIGGSGISLANLFHRMSYLLKTPFSGVHRLLNIDIGLLEPMLVEDPEEEAISQGAGEISKIRRWFGFTREEMGDILYATYLPIFPREESLVGYGVFEDDDDGVESITSMRVEALTERIMQHVEE